jgi:hypothetical protein
VVEERGGPLEFIHASKDDDQLDRSMAVSSCDSGDRGDRGPELAMVVGDEFGESDSDVSVTVGQKVADTVQVVVGTSAGNKNLKTYSPGNSRSRKDSSPILSKLREDKTKEGGSRRGENVEEAEVRGLSPSNLGDCDRCVVVVCDAGSVDPAEEGLVSKTGGQVGLGPVLLERVDPVAQESLMKGNSVISKLDVLVVEARDRSQANLVQSLP